MQDMRGMQDMQRMQGVCWPQLGCARHQLLPTQPVLLLPGSYNTYRQACDGSTPDVPALKHALSVLT